jgi:high affinity Mn2+ porin
MRLLIQYAWGLLLAGALGAGAIAPSRAADAAPEAWQLKFQTTAVVQYKPAFSAPYTGANSLLTNHEYSRTVTSTLFAGLRPWTGGEIYFNPEMSLGVPFSDLKGTGGFTNGEIARTSGPDPRFYRARLFLRQTWGLGGESESVESDQNQLGGRVSTNRLVFTLGNVSALDIFDDNKYSHEPRRQFLNWALMTHGAWDFPADARGYTWGAALEYITPQWALRGGRFMMPKDSNGLPLNSRIMSSYGDALEFERGYKIAGRDGRVRLLAFRNQAVMGSFGDAIAQSAASNATPDLTQVRTAQAKVGGGINIEQDVRDDVGVFLRASASDGKTEAFAFTEIDRSVSGGALLKGVRWGRPADEIGVAFAVNGLSSTHRDYFARGGLGFFLGDGRLNYRSEQIVETYYSLKVAKPLWLSFDYQHIHNPGYNADRGPANFFGVRVHLEL